MAKTDETRLDQTTVSTDKTTNTASQQSDMPVLRLDDVSYSYTKGGKRVLKNISHDFQSGSDGRILVGCTIGILRIRGIRGRTRR